jgi:hypothetical protein
LLQNKQKLLGRPSLSALLKKSASRKKLHASGKPSVAPQRPLAKPRKRPRLSAQLRLKPSARRKRRLGLRLSAFARNKKRQPARLRKRPQGRLLRLLLASKPKRKPAGKLRSMLS